MKTSRHITLYTPLALSLLLAYGTAWAQTAAPGGLPSERPVGALSEVRVTVPGANASGTLRGDIVKTESISAQAIERSNASNLTEAVDKRPGISVQVECSVCNARSITLNNLPGRFTTVLIDGIALYSSVSSAYGLDSVNVLGLERIDIARGAGASLVAPEALTGTVNLVTKRPLAAEYVLRAQAGSFGSYGVDAYLARPLEGGAIALSLDQRSHDAVDATGGGISQFTGYDRSVAGLGYFIDNLAGFKVRGRVDVVREHRGGGALGRDYAAIKASTTGNPFNFSAGPGGSPDPRGWVTPDGSGTDVLSNGQQGTFYADGRAGLSQIVHTERQQLTLIGERFIAGGKLRLAAGAAQHDQDSFYGGDALYHGKQNQYYLESAYEMPVGESLLTLGANYRFEDLHSEGYAFSSGQSNNDIDSYAYRTPALFAQLYQTALDERLEMNASIRIDQHNVFGTIASPRLNLLYQHDGIYASRVSLGRGFRAPTSFFEQEHGILADSRIVRNISEPERSDNLSYSLNYATDRFNWTGSFNFNRITNFAVLTPGQPDPDGGPLTVTLFGSSPEPVVQRSVDWTGTWQLSASTTASLGAELSSFSFAPGTLSFARPTSRAFVGLTGDIGDWDLSAKLSWTGPQDLARFYDYANTPRFNLDGTAKPDTSPSFSVLDMRAQRRLSKTVSAFVGVDNLLDYQQAKIDGFLWVDSTGALDVTHIWGPQRGRYVYAGIRLEL